MRLKILANEESDLMEEANEFHKKVEGVKSACNILEIEKKDVEDRLQLLLEEKSLIESHLDQQRKKLQSVLSTTHLS